MYAVEGTSGPPKCTGDATDCRLCTVIRQIFQGFPKEVDPGCEVGNRSCVATEPAPAPEDIRYARERAGISPAKVVPSCTGKPVSCGLCDDVYKMAPYLAERRG